MRLFFFFCSHEYGEACSQPGHGGIAHALFVLLRSGGVMERPAERRDAQKRRMFPRQMGIIHAARVSAALRAPEYTGAC